MCSLWQFQAIFANIIFSAVQRLKLFFCMLLIHHIKKELQIEVEDISADYILDS